MGRYSGTAALLVVLVLAGGCDRGGGGPSKESAGEVAPPGGQATAVSQTAQGPVRLATSDLATGLDTPWSMAFDKDGKLWFTERPGRVRRLGDPPEIGRAHV